MRLCRCGAIVDSVCSKCDEANTAQNKAFYSSWKWRRLSERKRSEQPLCEQCLQAGVVTAATEVHHIVGVDESEALRLEYANLMSVCGDCHDRLDEERREGRGRVKSAGQIGSR